MSYPVLDLVSKAYPRVRGRLPTCYSPVRHSSTPERASAFDLHVLSTPPAFVLSQDQTLQQMNSINPGSTPTHQNRAGMHQPKKRFKPFKTTHTNDFTSARC